MRFNNTVDSLKESAKSNGYGYKAYVGAVYGSTVTPSIYEDYSFSSTSASPALRLSSKNQLP